MLQCIYLSFLSIDLKKRDINNIIMLLEYIKDGIKLVYINGYKHYCYLVLANLMVDYEKQVLIANIETNMQYSIYHILSKKKESITRS